MPARSRLWPDPRVKPPYGAAEIDQAHPLANGLRGYYLCQGSGVSLGFNLAGPSLPVVTGAPSSKVGPAGVGFLGNGSASIHTTVRPVTDYPFSIVARAEWDGTVPSGYASIASFGDPGASSYMFMGIKSATSLQLEDNGSGVNLVMTAAAPINTPFTCGRSSALNTTHRVFYNGGFVTSTTSGPDTTLPNMTHFTVNAMFWTGSTATLFAQGITYWIGLWARGLSDAEMLWLHAEPYALLRPIVRRRYIIPAVGASTIPRKMHHYERLR